jgi:D-aminoacyl-tRNA deacylase
VRVLLQRVSRAEVRVAGGVTGRIGTGLLLFVGFTHADAVPSVTWMADKVAGLRLFADADGKMNLGLSDVDGAVLVVSQFTLYGDTNKGRRPTWQAAAPGPVAEPLVDAVIGELRNLGAHVETGKFGADMKVALVNDGPVTLILEL